MTDAKSETPITDAADLYDYQTAVETCRRLEKQLAAAKADAERLAKALETARSMLIEHHASGYVVEAGKYCPVCHRDGAENPEAEIDEIYAALAAHKKS